QKDEDPYHERYIPRLANAALPLVREALERHTTLYDGFAARYIVAGRKALGQDADSLAFRFSSPAILGDSELRDAYMEVLQPRFFVNTEQELATFTGLNVVRVMTRQQAQRGVAELRALDGGRLE